jgi:predicted DNA-binding protein
MPNHDLPPPNPLAAAKEKRIARSFRLPISLWQRFDKLAVQTGATVTDLLEQAVRYYFAAIEKDQRPRR